MNEYQTWLIIAILVLVWVRTESVAAQLRSTREQLLRLQNHLGLGPLVAAEPSELVRQLAKDPEQRLEAIKKYRQETGVDLKAAKQVVERLAAKHGEA